MDFCCPEGRQLTENYIYTKKKSFFFFDNFFPLKIRVRTEVRVLTNISNIQQGLVQ